jgi:lysophospholipid acyltransferase
MLVGQGASLLGVDASDAVLFLQDVAPKKAKLQVVQGFFTWSMLRLLVYQWLAMQIYRCTFYFAWLISEGANNLAGLGFKGNDKEGNPDWSALTNLSTRKVEFADNMKTVLDNWNIQTQRWLVFVCYERLPKSYNTYATMLLSALWHGPYLGYYMTFATAAFVVEANRKVRNNIRPYFMPTGAKQSNSLYVACHPAHSTPWLCVGGAREREGGFRGG